MFQKRRHGKVDFNRYLVVLSRQGVKKAKSPSNIVRQQGHASLHSHFRDWVDYRDGFGDFKVRNDEFWLGNERIHSLLSEGLTHHILTTSHI